MFYRMTRLHFDEDRFEELLHWAHSVRPRLESLRGLLFADLVRGTPEEGMMIAAFSDRAGFEAVAGEVEAVLEEMGGYLTDAPHGHSGTVFFSYRPEQD